MIFFLLVVAMGGKGKHELSSTCAPCHGAIYEEWKNSMHAYAMVDPIFQKIYETLSIEQKEYCTNCHSPLSHYEVPPEDRGKLILEGVTCDFCHTAVSGEIGKGKWKLDPGGTKRGPLEDASDVAHPVAYSPLHTQSEFCGVCHQAVNANGVAVLNTYEEWKESPYPGEGITCQKCHMPEEVMREGPGGKEGAWRATFPSHRFTGGHSPARLELAARLSVLAWKAPDKISVSAFVTNEESGHWLPTGIPSRYLLLTVRLLDRKGNILKTHSVRFQRILQDRAGNPIASEEVPKMFFESAGVYQDNRILPKETKRVEVDFPFPEGGIKDVGAVEAVLSYHLPIPWLTPPELRVEMARALLLLPGAPSKWKNWLFLLLFVVVLVAVYSLVRITVRRGK
ncbi:MAG: multiheme c-type cytochrome [bacterium JZ-2024 1]